MLWLAQHRLNACRVLIVASVVIAAAACTADGQSPAPGANETPAKASRVPVVNGIDHFFATSPNPEPLYRFFRDTLALPEVFPIP